MHRAITQLALALAMSVTLQVTAVLSDESTMDDLKLAKTQEVAEKVYDLHKPEIKAARLQDKAEHPKWTGK
jgi:hypothetical protein